jgi:hypothetical protein
MREPAMSAVIDPLLLLELVAFVDEEHEYTALSGCHPQPGEHCVAWCEACKLIARVPRDLTAGARALLRDRGVDRD